MELNIEEKVQYQQNAEIHTAVHSVGILTIEYAKVHTDYNELTKQLIRFFVNYDKFRTKQIEDLKAKLVDCIMRSPISIQNQK